MADWFKQVTWDKIYYDQFILHAEHKHRLVPVTLTGESAAAVSLGSEFWQGLSVVGLLQVISAASLQEQMAK